MASIERRAAKGGVSYRVKWRDGAGRQRSKTYRTAREARRFLKDVEARLEFGGYRDPTAGSICFHEWFWTTLAAAEIREKTRVGYESLYRTWLETPLGALPMNTIRPIDIQMVLSGMDRSASRKRQVYALVHRVLRLGVENDLLTHNPASRVDRPRVASPEQAFLSATQLHELADSCGHYRPLILLLGYGGCRWGEAMALDSADVSTGRVRIWRSRTEIGGRAVETPTKSGRSRQVALPPQVLEALASAATPPFTCPKGDPIRHGNFTHRVFKPAARALGVPELRIHDLRHTCATLLVRAGAHPKVIQGHLGHSSIRVTLDTYGHLFDDSSLQVAGHLSAIWKSAQLQ